MRKLIVIPKAILVISPMFLLGTANASVSGAPTCQSIFAMSANLTDQNQSIESAIVGRDVVNKIVKDLGPISQLPQELRATFGALNSGSMSLSVFKKISAEYPNLTGSVSILILKSHLKALNMDNGYSADGRKVIQTTFEQFGKTFKFQSETQDYYVLEMSLKGPSDAQFLGDLSTATMTSPFIFQGNEGLPTKRFFKLPSSVFRDLSKTVFQMTNSRGGPRYGIINTVESRNNMTYEALKAVVEYDGKAPLNIVYSVSKKSLEEMKTTQPKYYQQDLTKIVEDSGFKAIDSVSGKYLRLADTAESVSFQITIRTVDEIRTIVDLFDLSFDSKFSLP